MDIFQFAVIGLVGAILAMIVKAYKPEYGLYIVIATVLLLFSLILGRLRVVFEFLGSVYNEITYGQVYFPIILKVLAVAYVSDFIASICKDAGESAIASKLELAGKIIIFYLAIPVMVSIFELISSLLPR